jgi:hypothetical protein
LTLALASGIRRGMDSSSAMVTSATAVIRAWRHGHDDASRRGGGNVDVVHSDTVLGDEAEARTPIHEAGIDRMEGYDPGVCPADFRFEVAESQSAALAPFQDGAPLPLQPLQRLRNLTAEGPCSDQYSEVLHLASSRPAQRVGLPS